jgi:hypothetical protein
MPAAQLALDGLRAGISHLAKKPTELLVVARHAAGLRAVIPLDALRWLIERSPSKKGPKDIVLGANPPYISVGLTADLMGNAIRAELDIKIEDLRVGPDELQTTMRLANVKLNALDPKSPAAMLFKSLDLSKPANLANFLPKKPAALVEAAGDRVVVDFLKIPKLSENPVFQRILKLLSPLVDIREIRTEGDHILIGWRPRPTGIGSAIAALRG